MSVDPLNEQITRRLSAQKGAARVGRAARCGVQAESVVVGDLHVCRARWQAPAARAAAERQAAVARQGGLQEWLADAWLLEAQARQLAGEHPARCAAAAPKLPCWRHGTAWHGLADIHQRAQAWLTTVPAGVDGRPFAPS